MKNSSIAKSLGKVIIAAAWADGEIPKEELDCLKDLLFQLPELSAEDWQEFDLILANPVNARQRRAFIDELKTLLPTEDERNFAFYALDCVICADEIITPSEKRIVQSMKAALWNVNVRMVKKIENLLKKPLKIRTKANTPKFFQAFEIESMLQNRIGSMLNGQLSMNMEESELRKLCLAGILLARVIKADGVIDDAEIKRMVQFLKERWELSHEEAQFVVMVSLSDNVSDLDLIRVARWFYELTDKRERLQFLSLLFQVGQIDGILTEDEMDEIINIAANLKIEQDAFQTAFNGALETAK